MRIDAQAIKDNVSMQNILDYYGYKPKHGFIVCPFHAENAPSLKVYQSSWHCFGCKRGGSVIDFVMEHESCSYSTALVAIDTTFHLGLSHPVFDPQSNLKKLKAELFDGLADIQIEQEQFKKQLYENSIRGKLIRLQEIEEKPIQYRTAGECTELIVLQDAMERLEDKKDRCDEMIEAVSERRRNYRKQLNAR